MSERLLSVRGLHKLFPIRRGLFGRVEGHVHAVEGVDLDLAPRETLGLVGESGCGKTTAGRTILRLIEPTSGSICFEGVDLATLAPEELRATRRFMQIVFQDPYSSLNPRMTVESTVGEGLLVHGIAKSASERRERVAALLDRVGLGADAMARYPHEFSGGQRQRIGIARALAVGPKFIVCDEPVSALDVSVQAQIVNLLMDLQDELGLSYLFISHDLSLVEHGAHRVAVMYLGRIVETAPAARLYEDPRHPYTRALLSAVPEIDPGRRKSREALSGEPPSPVSPPPGCRFHPRCAHAFERCRTEAPPLYDLGGGHLSRCFLSEGDAKAETSG